MNLVSTFASGQSCLVGRIIAVMSLLVLYFPAASYLGRQFVAPDPTVMHPPFRHVAGNAYASYKPLPGSQADSQLDSRKSTVQLLENDEQLGPAHSPHADINSAGGGRYTYWSATGGGSYLIFSTSDNSDPNVNGRTYRAVDPNAQDPFEAQRRR
jgi:hypothetical protein